MDIKDKEERIKLFMQLIDMFKADAWVDNIFEIIKEYDLPKHMDRDFVLSALEHYYVKKEAYERCADLVKWKGDEQRRDLFAELEEMLNASPTGSIQDHPDKYSEGFHVPDSIRTRFKKRKK